jgi:hypothetical protein
LLNVDKIPAIVKWTYKNNWIEYKKW